MIRETHLGLIDLTSGGVMPSPVLFAFLQHPLPSSRTVKALLDMGCDINETYAPDGWNCLFLQSMCASSPNSSYEFDTLRCTLRHRGDIFAKDAAGRTVFDHVNATSNLEFSGYRRDLWYCALQREGIDVGPTAGMQSRVAVYNRFYTPQHYRALCYLDDWTEKDLSRQVHETLEGCPWTEEEISELSRIHDEEEREIRALAAKRKRREDRRLKEKRAGRR
jgi:hypothetical protein